MHWAFLAVLPLRTAVAGTSLTVLQELRQFELLFIIFLHAPLANQHLLLTGFCVLELLLVEMLVPMLTSTMSSADNVDLSNLRYFQNSGSPTFEDSELQAASAGSAKRKQL